MWNRCESNVNPSSAHGESNMESNLNPMWIKCGSNMNPTWIQFESNVNQTSIQCQTMWIHCESTLNPMWVQRKSDVSQMRIHCESNVKTNESPIWMCASCWFELMFGGVCAGSLASCFDHFLFSCLNMKWLSRFLVLKPIMLWEWPQISDICVS